MDMRTDLIAVPHAGLGFHFLRVQVRKPKRKRRYIQRRSQRFQVASNSKRKDTDRADDKVTTFVQKNQAHNLR